MRTYLIIGLSYFAVLTTASDGYGENAVFVSSCGGVRTPYFNVRDACRSGEYAGARVVKCYRRDGDWSQRDIGLCPTPDRKRGVYVGTCHGEYIGLDEHPERGCQDPARVGQTLVYCKYGQVDEVVHCYRNRSTSPSTHDGIFLNDCHGEAARDPESLSKACQSHPGAVVMACEATCLKRRWFSCVERQWLGGTARICGEPKKTEARAELEGCTYPQISKVDAALTAIAQRLPKVIAAAREGLVQTPNDPLMTRVRTAIAAFEKIEKKLNDTQEYRCLSINESRCSRGLVTYARFLEPIGLCPSFFDETRTVEENAGALVHELAHKAGVNRLMKEEPFFEDHTQPPRSYRGTSWEKLADTYAWWFRNGFCIPTLSCHGDIETVQQPRHSLDRTRQVLAGTGAQGTTQDDGPIELIGFLSRTKGAQLTVGGRILKCTEKQRPNCASLYRTWSNHTVKVRGRGYTYTCGPQEQCVRGGHIRYLKNFTITPMAAVRPPQSTGDQTADGHGNRGERILERKGVPSTTPSLDAGLERPPTTTDRLP
ncbi:MAG: hypothetical protein VX589_00920 [Myxococcota bacterium]|nr:hypothetical protein [Myxococcota bacterium]